MVATLAMLDSNAQETVRKVRPFSRIIASPYINIILEEGESETVRLLANNVSDRLANWMDVEALRAALTQAGLEEKKDEIAVQREAAAQNLVLKKELEREAAARMLAKFG